MSIFLPSNSTVLFSSKHWLRTCTPEFKFGSTLNSSSSRKSAKSRVVHRNELAVFATDVPTICPSSTRYLALPPRGTQPERSLPLQRLIQPSSGGGAAGLLVQ